MAKKKDQKLIASKQKFEMSYITSTWVGEEGNKLSMEVLKTIVKKIGRSRRAVYAVLRYLSYKYVPRGKK